jgi:hypothetical protein
MPQKPMPQQRSRWIAFLFLVISIVVMLGIGLYLSATHQAVHPLDSGSPGSTQAPPH